MPTNSPEYWAAYYAKNKLKIAKRKKAYYRRNREIVLMYQNAYNRKMRRKADARKSAKAVQKSVRGVSKTSRKRTRNKTAKSG